MVVDRLWELPYPESICLSGFVDHGLPPQNMASKSETQTASMRCLSPDVNTTAHQHSGMSRWNETSYAAISDTMSYPCHTAQRTTTQHRITFKEFYIPNSTIQLQNTAQQKTQIVGSVEQYFSNLLSTYYLLNTTPSHFPQCKGSRIDHTNAQYAVTALNRTQHCTR